MCVIFHECGASSDHFHCWSAQWNFTVQLKLEERGAKVDDTSKLGTVFEIRVWVSSADNFTEILSYKKKTYCGYFFSVIKVLGLPSQ